jgi:DNA-binding response OmpR family regulator
MKVLLIDDDPGFRRLTAEGLREARIEHRSVGSVAEARDALAAEGFDAILLDLELPGEGGLEFLEELRAGGDPIPVLVLTAHEAVEKKVAGLDLGADDYLVKPLEHAELRARLAAVLRRHRGARELRVGALLLDLDLRRVWLSERPVDLSPKEFELLFVLARNAGRTVARTELLQTVWNLSDTAETNVLEVHVGRLRKKLRFSGAEPIETVRGEGYRLTVPPGNGPPGNGPPGNGPPVSGSSG